MARKTTSHNLLVVEGPSDKHVVRHLCERHPPTPEFDIEERNGVAPLLEAIRPDLRVAGRQALGIVVDADDNPAGRWLAVADRLRAAYLEPPLELLEPPLELKAGGTILDGTPRAGVWLMPDNHHQGELEDLLVALVPPDDPVWPRASQYINDIPTEHRKFRPQKAQRAKLYAWLAAVEKPRPLGTAVAAGDFVTESPMVTAFVHWLRRLFTPPG